MFISHQDIRKYIGHHVRCHTPFGTFQGVIVNCTKRHVILAPAPRVPLAPSTGAHAWPERPFPFGPGPGPGPWGPGPGWGGGGWSLAIPLAAIIGVTAIGLHWW